MGGKGWVPFSQLSRGKACVEFSSATDARKAIETLNGSELDGRKIKVGTWTQGKSPMSKKGDDSCKVYVANLAWKTRDWKLKEHFGKAGNVAFAKVIADRPAKVQSGGGWGKGGSGGWDK